MKLWRWRCTLWIVDVHTYSTSGHVESESERRKDIQRFEAFLWSLLLEILDLVLIALTLIQTSLPKVSNQCNLIGTINVLRSPSKSMYNIQNTRFGDVSISRIRRLCSEVALIYGMACTKPQEDLTYLHLADQRGWAGSPQVHRAGQYCRFLGDLWATLLFFRKLMGPCGEILSFSSQSSLPCSFRSLTTPSLNQKIRSSAAWIYGQLEGATEILCQKSIHFYLLSSLLSVLLLSDLLHRPQKQFKLKHGNGCRPCFRDIHSTFWPVRTCL